ncbi:MAG: Bug family tripartite tricarboxylate transporter substrate binding protein [Desulfobulbia bacterium]
MRTMILSATIVMLSVLLVIPALAEYPEKPIKLIVPFGQGGSTSIQARTFQKAIADNDLLPQPITIAYVPGAAGSVGARQVKDSEPNGYTTLIWHVAASGSREMGNVDFGPEAFEPIAGTGRQCYFLLVRESSQYQTLDELMKAAKAKPDEILAGVNLGGANHIGALLAEAALPGAAFRHVQTGGTAKVYPALLGGHVEVGVMPTSSIKNVGQNGIRLLGFMGAKRDPGFPEVPTMIEQGYPAEMCMTSWWFAPKGTPQDRVDILTGALEGAFNTDYVKQSYEQKAVDHVFLKGTTLKDAIAKEAEAIHKIGPRLRGTKK